MCIASFTAEPKLVSTPPQASRFQDFMALDYRAGVAIMVLTSVNALAYNVVHNAMIKLTSAVTTTVIGEAKIVGLFVLSALLLGARP